MLLDRESNEHTFCNDNIEELSEQNEESHDSELQNLETSYEDMFKLKTADLTDTDEDLQKISSATIYPIRTNSKLKADQSIQNRSGMGIGSVSKFNSWPVYHQDKTGNQSFEFEVKTMLEYLSEAATEEHKKIKRQMYISRSTSPHKKAKFGRENGKDKKSSMDKTESTSISNPEEDSIRKENGKKRHRRSATYLKNATSKILVLEDDLSIESFADFSDSLFQSITRKSTKLYKCPEKYCDVELPSLSRIKRHYLIHTNIKPFKCLNPKCDKRFSRKDNMLQHYRTHCKRGQR